MINGLVVTVADGYEKCQKWKGALTFSIQNPPVVTAKHNDWGWLDSPQRSETI
jgi:hypothetical protein